MTCKGYLLSPLVGQFRLNITLLFSMFTKIVIYFARNLCPNFLLILVIDLSTLHPPPPQALYTPDKPVKMSECQILNWGQAGNNITLIAFAIYTTSTMLWCMWSTLSISPLKKVPWYFLKLEVNKVVPYCSLYSKDTHCVNSRDASRVFP